MSECIVTSPAGRPCAKLAYNNVPVALCFDHAFSVYMSISSSVGMNLRNIHEAMERDAKGETDKDAARREAYAEQAQVYYIRIGDHIKIGFTQNLLERISGLRVDASDVLAAEPGGRAKERERHLQFADIRIGKRENFERTADLLTHIAKVRRENGKPKMTGYVKAA